MGRTGWERNMVIDIHQGYIQCEKMTLLDLTIRRYRLIDRLPLSELINISDAIQGIFEYI